MKTAQRHTLSPCDRKSYIEYLVKQGVETPTLARDLQEDDIVFEFGCFWEVFRLERRWTGIEIFFLPALDASDAWERKHSRRFDFDEPVCLMRAAYANP